MKTDKIAATCKEISQIMTRHLPSLNGLRAFEATARLGSLTQAARHLNVTHGAISRQLKLLEAELGVALFSKEGRGLRLTDAGLRLRDACSQAFDSLRTACAELAADQADAPFVLGCSGSLLARWFIPRLGRLNADLPDLRLHLSAGEGDLDPQSPSLDALLVYAQPPWPAEVQVHELLAERVGPVVSPHYRGCAALLGAPPTAVFGETLLQTDSRPQAWPAWARAHDLDSAGLKFSQRFEHLYYLLEAAVAGLGVAIAPHALVADDLQAGRLVAPWGFSQTTASLMLWVPRRRAGSRAERLAEWLRQELARQADQWERLQSR
ncbi:LysR family transcriptional regulator [Pseudomonas massiliensis]|uniref:LysR family transcriptional regulator n=1 Tax=Pseudomonas massiliensis TaxID=522492 RepID=UPI001652B494|nr:LysR family transcriptional regulator [Pseudomonas massiliensis]